MIRKNVLINGSIENDPTGAQGRHPATNNIIFSYDLVEVTPA